MRHQPARRLSAVLLSLLLAFGAATCRLAAEDRSVAAATPDSPVAVMAAGGTGTAQAAGERQGHPRLAVTRGQAGALLFLVALAALLAGVRRPHAWSLTATPPWSLPAAAGAWAPRGRAPPPARTRLA